MEKLLEVILLYHGMIMQMLIIMISNLFFLISIQNFQKLLKIFNQFVVEMDMDGGVIALVLEIII